MTTPAVDDLSCGFCRELFVDPLQLSCAHSICSSCFERVKNFKLLQGSATPTITCAICVTPTPIPDATTPQLAPTHALDERLEQEKKRRALGQTQKLCGMCEETAAITECIQCEVAYCEPCQKKVHKTAAFSKHKFAEIGAIDNQRKKTCVKHKGRELDAFCVNDQQLVCLYCAQFAPEHRGHQCQPLASAVEEEARTNDVGKRIELCRKKLENLDTMRTQIENAQKKLSETYEQASTQVNKTFDALIAALQARRDSLLQTLAKSKTEHQTALERKCQVLSKVQDYTRSLLASAPYGVGADANAKVNANANANSSTPIDAFNLLAYKQQLCELQKELDAVPTESISTVTLAFAGAEPADLAPLQTAASSLGRIDTKVTTEVLNTAQQRVKVKGSGIFWDEATMPEHLTISEDGLTLTHVGSGWRTVLANKYVVKGKYYFEVLVVRHPNPVPAAGVVANPVSPYVPGGLMVGVCASYHAGKKAALGSFRDGWGINVGDAIFHYGKKLDATTKFPVVKDGDTVGVSINFVARTLQFFVNRQPVGALIQIPQTLQTQTGETVHVDRLWPAISLCRQGQVIQANFRVPAPGEERARGGGS